MTPFRCKDTYRLKVRGWKKVFHRNRNQRNTEIAINTYIRQNRLQSLLEETKKDDT